jgi:diguanylate cyclase
VEIQWARRRGALLRLPPIGALWSVAAIVVVLYAAHQGLGLGGRGVDGLFDDWINDGLLWCAAVACAGGALRARRSRAAWLLVALALAVWAIGDTIWSIRFGDAAAAPATSISDVFWLAWYPLIVGALVLLVRERVPGFELHRWIDGIAVMLLLATPWVALFLQPVAEHSSASGLAVVLDFAYPLGDAILVGAVLGVFALMGWRPGRMWLLLGVALTVMGLADAISSVQALAHSHDRGIYDPAWAGAAMLVAYAAWQPHPGRLERQEVIGFQAIALAIAAQVLAIGIQIYAIFDELPRSERILTVIVLIIATVQIVVSRPRPRSDPQAPRDAPASAGSVITADRSGTSQANKAPPKAH